MKTKLCSLVLLFLILLEPTFAEESKGERPSSVKSEESWFQKNRTLVEISLLSMIVVGGSQVESSNAQPIGAKVLGGIWAFSSLYYMGSKNQTEAYVLPIGLAALSAYNFAVLDGVGATKSGILLANAVGLGMIYLANLGIKELFGETEISMSPSAMDLQSGQIVSGLSFQKKF